MVEDVRSSGKIKWERRSHGQGLETTLITRMPGDILIRKQ